LFSFPPPLSYSSFPFIILVLFHFISIFFSCPFSFLILQCCEPQVLCLGFERDTDHESILFIFHYFYKYCVSGQYPLSCFYLKQHFKDWILSLSSGGTYSVGLSVELVPISRHLHQQKVGYINQAWHKPSARVKKNIKNTKKTPHTGNKGIHPRPVVDHLISQPILDISPIWTLIITAEVRKLQLRPVQIMRENCVFMLVPYREFFSLVMTSILIVL
jgi:hypothetical protein